MASGKHNKNDKFQKAMELLKVMKLYTANLDDILDAYLELVEDEYISPQIFERTIENELYGTIRDLDNALTFYRGLQ